MTSDDAEEAKRRETAKEGKRAEKRTKEIKCLPGNRNSRSPMAARLGVLRLTGYRYGRSSGRCQRRQHRRLLDIADSRINGRQQHRPILTKTLDPYRPRGRAKLPEKVVFPWDRGHRRPIDDDHRTGGDASALRQATGTQLERIFEWPVKKRTMDVQRQHPAFVCSCVGRLLQHPNSNRPI
jgi:hypothetical protein